MLYSLYRSVLVYIDVFREEKRVTGIYVVIRSERSINCFFFSLNCLFSLSNVIKGVYISILLGS